MQIIPSCTKIVSALSICSSHSLPLFTELESFLHVSYLMALTIPYLSVLASLPFPFKLPLIFTIISFALNDPFHPTIGVHGALHRLRASLSLPRLVSLLFLSSSVHAAQPERNQADKWGHTVHTNTDKPLNRVQHVTILQGHECTRVNAD